MVSLRAMVTRLSERVTQLSENILALDRLMEAKFVTIQALMHYEADKVALALAASKEAIAKADAADEKARDRLADDMKARFNSVNEFRGALSDSQANNVSRLEFDQFVKHYTEQHTLLRDRYSEEIADLKERLSKSGGRTEGFSGAWSIIVAVAGIAIAIGALVFRNM